MSKPAAHQYDEQILDLLDGNLPEYEQADLRDWLNESPAHWERFAQLSFLHSQIANQLTNQRSSDGVRLDALRAEPIETELPPIHITSSDALTKQQYISALTYVLEHTFTPKRIATLAAAAVLLLGMVVAIALLTGPDTSNQIAEQPTQTPDAPIALPIAPPIKPTVATISATHNAQWAPTPAERASARGSNLVTGSSLHPNQRLTLTAGFAEITTNNGAIAILEAPVTIELLDNNNALRLHAGKLVGICETPSSKGFVIKTDHADITDIGTKFGVEVANNLVTTTVFTGSIELNATGHQSKTLMDNQTASVTVQDGERELIVEDRLASGFERMFPRLAVATASWISDERFTVEIVPSGVREDAPLFTDRDYELNGVDAAGLPAELLGGDLIRTPSSARPLLTPGTEDFSIQIDLGQKADVYILYNALHETPDWLEADYTKTPMVVGMDASNQYSTIFPSAILGVGPGNEIDQVFHVWKRNQPATGTVTTGSYESTQSGMYSIIIQPHQSNNKP